MLVAHFSDLHQLDLEGVRLRQFVGKRATGAINLMLSRGGEFPTSVARTLIRDVVCQRPDHVIVSGDLTNLSLVSEFELVRGLLERLELPPSEVTVIPGNHDYYTRGSARRDDFGRIMAAHVEGDEVAERSEGASLEPRVERTRGGARFPLLRVRGELAVVALCSAHPTPPLMAHGTLGSRQTEAAGRLLSGAACRDRFRLVVLHHPPHVEHTRWHNRLTDRARFRAMIGQEGADLVVHGHLHRAIRTQIAGPAGPVPVIGVGSGTWLSPEEPARRAQYNLYRIEDGRLAQVVTRRLDASRLGFETM